jgi:uncharacterized protein (DUF342 family)
MPETLFTQEASATKRCEIKRYGYTLVFALSPDEVECRCIYEPSSTGGTPLTELELQGYLTQFKITEGIIPESFAFLLNSAATVKPVEDLLFALGIPAIAGENGQIINNISDDLQQCISDDAEYASIDFRNVQSFLNTNEGSCIATIKPPGYGKPGRTVTGKIITPQPGAPAKIELGQNVRLSEDRKSIVSLAAGRVCLRGNAVSVEDIYEIDGDVDFKIGNISFKGYVEIKGDVLDGFFVKATKGIKIQGNIGVCAIESDGDISFCGMNGQGSGTIKSGGFISANFISDALVECSGDITAEAEIRSSQIKCLGSITVIKGGLTGGEYFALAGIECGSLGSRSSFRTRVVAGVHYADLEELNFLFNEIKSLVAEFAAAPKGSIDVKEFASKRADITDRTHEVRARTYERCNPKINVKNTLHDGVNITLGNTSVNITEERRGPVSIIENTIEGGLRYLGMTTLSFTAQSIENTFMQQYLLEQLKSREQQGEDI